MTTSNCTSTRHISPFLFATHLFRLFPMCREPLSSENHRNSLATHQLWLKTLCHEQDLYDITPFHTATHHLEPKILCRERGCLMSSCYPSRHRESASKPCVAYHFLLKIAGSVWRHPENLCNFVSRNLKL